MSNPIVSNLFDTPASLDVKELHQIMEFHTGQALGESMTTARLPNWAHGELRKLEQADGAFMLRHVLVFHNEILLLTPEFNQYALISRTQDDAGINVTNLEYTRLCDAPAIAQVFEFLGVAKSAAMIRQPDFHFSRWHGYGQPVAVERSLKSLTDAELAAMVAADIELVSQSRATRLGATA